MKIAFVVIDIIAIIILLFTISAIHKNVKASYGFWLGRALAVANIAIAANILIALSPNELTAKIAYCLYFASMSWVVYFLVGFLIIYTDQEKRIHAVKGHGLVLIILDSISMLLTPLLNHAFTIFEISDHNGTSYYQTKFMIPYYIHLLVCYTAIVLALIFVIIQTARSYNVYRIKNAVILSVLFFVILLNVVYMLLHLPLDASIIFYGVGGAIIYIAISKIVPWGLMLSSLVRAIDDMIEGLILFDINDNCIYANDFSTSRFGIDIDTFSLASEPCGYVIDELTRIGNRFGSVLYKTEGSKKGDTDGTRHYNIRYNCLNDDKGRIIGSYFLIEDSTDQVHYMDEVRAARDEANEANNAKSSFLANMSHEIRTPLNSMLGMNEMIMRSTDDPMLTEYAQNIKISGDTLLGLINDILDFSKIEAKKMDVVEANYNPHDLIRTCVNSFEQSAESKDLYLNVRCDKDLPSVLLGDQKLINQVLSNIISNAIKYTREGGITLDVSRTKGYGSIMDIVFSISDTGIGIEKEDIPLMFDSFNRLNEHENATIQGTGLGLAITKELVNLLEGTITVESTPGSGSTFTIMLPQKIVDSAPAGEFVRHLQAVKRKYTESFKAKDANILVVDDAKMNLKVIQALLKKTELNIDLAGGGNEAIEMCNNKKYDCILLDHRMPDPDGIETFCIISSTGLNTDTPVIMLTANVVNGAEENYKKTGFADYLAKPVRSEDLEAVLVKHLPPEKVTLL